MATASADPRTKTTPAKVWEQVGTSLAKGFETRLTTPGGAFYETLQAQKEVARSLEVLARKMESEVGARGTQMSAWSPSVERATHVRRAASTAHSRARSMADSAPRRADPSHGAHWQPSPQAARATPDSYRKIESEGGWNSLVGQTRTGLKNTIYRATARGLQDWAMPDGFANGITLGADGKTWLPPGHTMGAGGQVLDATGRALSEGEYNSVLKSALPPSVRMQKTGRLTDAKGQFVSASQAASLMSDAASMRRAGFADTLGNSLDAWRNGAPVGRALASALPTGALKFAGGVGLAWGAVNKGIDFVQGQEAQNQKYQGVYGYGSADAFKDRARSWVNRNIRGRFSMLGSDGYDELWNNAVNMGLRGGERERYINTGASLARVSGGNAKFASELMDVSIQAGQSLRGLTTAIKGVNEAAKEAGINGNKARALFLENYKATSQTAFGGIGAKPMAAALTKAVIGLGRAYEGVNYNGSYTSNTMHYATAASQGMSGAALWSQMSSNPAMGMKATEDIIRMTLLSITGENGLRLPDAARQYVTENPGFNVERDLQRLSNWLEARGFDRMIASAVLSSLGVSATQEQALGVAASYFIHGASPAQVLSQTQNDLTTSLTEGKNVTVARPLANSDTTPKDPYRGAKGWVTDLYRSGDTGNYRYTTSGGEGVNTFQMNIKGALGEFASDPGKFGIKDGTKVSVLVNDEWTVMTWREAVANFRDQIEAGEFKFVEGGGVDKQFEGQFGYQALGLVQGLDVSKPADFKITSSSGVKAPKGAKSEDEYLKDYLADHPSDVTAQNVNVLISLTDEARALFYANYDPYGYGPQTATGNQVPGT